MPLHNLSLESLVHLDCGNAALAFDRALRRAIDDCVDRPREERARKIVLQCEITPECGDDGQCDDLSVTIQVKEIIPAMSTTPTLMTVRKQGQQRMLVFESEQEDAA